VLGDDALEALDLRGMSAVVRCGGVANVTYGATGLGRDKGGEGENAGGSGGGGLHLGGDVVVFR
jgi:hypothetical protein